MRMRLAAAALIIAAIPAAEAVAMPVSTFLDKADRLQRKGPLALFSGDLKLLMNQVKKDARELRSERLAAKAAGKPTDFCPPEAGTKLTDKDVLAAMQAIPPARRASTTTKQALKASLVQRYPCR
jgi:hypothetical protein